MKIPKSVFKILENKYVLYFVLFLAVFNLLGYMIIGNINAVILFILIGGLMTFFSKNMIIILTVPLILTSVLLVGHKVSEGLQNASDSTTDTTGTTGTTGTTRPKVQVKQAIKSNLQNDIIDDSNDTSTSTVAASTPDTTTSDTSTPDATTTPEQMSLYKKKNNRIDYASTLEDAYGDLNNILGKDGISNLTTDTQKLMDQQMQLADALKGMAPLIGDAKKMLAGMDISGLTSMAKKFGQNSQQLQ